jgi:hypothetical protein
MLENVIKALLTGILVIAISEVAKRSTVLGAIIASIPLTSVLAIVWLYAETGDGEKIAALSTSILWFVLPSLVLFIALPLMLRSGMNFWLSLALSLGCTTLAYLATLAIKARFGV